MAQPGERVPLCAYSTPRNLLPQRRWVERRPRQQCAAHPHLACCRRPRVARNPILCQPWQARQLAAVKPPLSGICDGGRASVRGSAHKGQDGGSEQNLNEEIVKLLEHELPQGRALLLVQLIRTILCPSLLHLCIGQALGTVHVQVGKHLPTKRGRSAACWPCAPSGAAPRLLGG